MSISDLQLAERLKTRGAELGFSLVGIAPATEPTGLPRLQSWLAQGFAGEMHYLPRRADAYRHPDHVLAGVRSVVMTAVNYKSPTNRSPTNRAPDVGAHPAVLPDESAASIPTDAITNAVSLKATNGGLTNEAATSEASVDADLPARIASYAQGGADYHDVLKPRLQALAEVLHAARPGCRTRCVIDTAPLLERDFARLAGLGWFGKNTMLIHKRMGSFQFLGAILTDVALPVDAPHSTSHCGSCTRCLEVCPTDAFPEPGVLDARRCISYLTIELKTQIPVELRPGIGSWLFGCDLCQDVCPWNRKPPDSTDPAFIPTLEFARFDALEILQADDDELRRRFRNTPLARTGPAGLKRNAAIVAGNARNQRAVATLIPLLQHPAPIVRGAAAWALGRIGNPAAMESLRQAAETELDEGVRREILDALEMNVDTAAAT